MESLATLMTDDQLDAAIAGLRLAQTQQGVNTMRWTVEKVLEILTDGQGTKEGNGEIQVGNSQGS